MKYGSSRLDPVKPSASAAVSQAAKEAKARGEDVIDLGLGEPDFDTPDHVIEAAYKAAKSGQTRYPPNDGTAEMKAAVVAKFKRDNELSYAAQEIIVCNGAKQVIFDAMMATLETGDEVLLCAPYFGQYKDMVLILGGMPKAIECTDEAGFRLTPEKLDQAITPETRWLFLNFPSNPAGATYSKNELEALGAVLEKHPQVLVLSDEIYEHIIFDEQHFCSFLSACPKLKHRALTVNGVSKSYAMTGWRIGYGAGPEPLIKAMTKVQSQISSGACSVAQAAAAAALNGPQECVEHFRSAFERRRNLVVKRVAEIDGLTLDPPLGAFYAFIGCAQLIGAAMPDGTSITDDTALAQYLLASVGIAAVPGSAYELSPYIRISTAVSDAVLSEAMDRLAACVQTLDRPYASDII